MNLKKALFFVGVSIVALYLIFDATGKVVRTFSGIGELIPEDMVTGRAYVNHLRGTVKDCRTYTFEELRQRYLEESEFKLRYMEVLQSILKKLSGR